MRQASEPVPPLLAPASSTRMTQFRWVILGLVFFGTTVNYVDRQVMGILAPSLQKQYGISESQYGNITAAFALAYACGQLAAGPWLDRIGTRVGYALAVAAWSVASALHALARGAWSFGFMRALLGVSESPNFPAATKTLAEWFPKRERALAMGVVNAGSNVGVVVAALMVPWLAKHYGWQWAFVGTAGLGVCWLALWIPIYCRPHEHSWVSPRELAYINSDPAEPAVKVPWRTLLTYRQAWAFALAKFMTDSMWWFYMNWLVKFLNEKYGHAECTFGGGMEHQTCTSLGVYLEYVVAHELSHQWWGDRVTCRDFHHIWLNEGFATYCEAIWAEAVSGSAAYHDDLKFNKFFGPGTIYVPDVTNAGRIFDSYLSYNKASWVLHMLRHVIGDSTFFTAMRQFSAQYAYSVAVTEDFRDVCEAVSGRDLHDFFQQWIYGEYYPSYRYNYTASPAAGGYDVALTLEQTQTRQLFNMPVDVTILTGLGDRTFVVPDSLASQTFTLHVDAEPTAVVIDKDDWILKTVESPVVLPPFDKGVLLVNGVSWATGGTEITSAYNDRAFWGDYPIDFWDHFDPPAGGYPATLPAPLGHGAVPADVLGHYRCLIWVGNNSEGDLTSWLGSPIVSYLQKGGNVLLMTRQGDQFLTDPLRDYLGINFATGTTIYDCIATRSGLTDIGRIGNHTTCVVLDTVFTRGECQLLYKADQNYTPDRGIGVLREPANGGTNRLNGARFIFLSGRPYRWNHVQLRANVMYMLLNYFSEPLDPTAVRDFAAAPGRIELSAALPNPFGDATVLRFTLPRATPVRIEVMDPAGRRVRSLLAGRLPAGAHEARWDGRDDAGRRLATGIYWAWLRTEGEEVTRKLVLMR